MTTINKQHLHFFTDFQLPVLIYFLTFVPTAEMKRHTNNFLPVTSQAQPEWFIFTLVCCLAARRMTLLQNSQLFLQSTA